MPGFTHSVLPKTLVLTSIGWSCLIGTTHSVSAQLIPDQTLPGENSIVQQGKKGQRILGGARRGPNLFHSFREFNVGKNRSVYFANPHHVGNILTRVTGQNPSNILGKLGVEGTANLFLVNPRGIVFGPNASLDIQGSFFATTAEHIPLGKTGFFDAVNPKATSLLAIAPEVDFWHHLNPTTASIQTQATLEVGQNLILSGKDLILEGQLVAGQHLTLNADRNLTIRDRAQHPFIAVAGKDLSLDGQVIDIFALNHPDSALASARNTQFISPQPIIGDAKFFTGGSFTIQTPEGIGGQLESQVDPVIRSQGDVRFNAYVGRSLHILAGGSVQIPDGIIITGADELQGLSEAITLFDGTSLEINGALESTLDIRAGVKAEAIQGTQLDATQFFPFSLNNFLFNPNAGDLPDLSTQPTRADILVGPISFTTPDLSTRTTGQALLTNQYVPNLALPGNIILTDGSVQPNISENERPDVGVHSTIVSRGAIEINRNINASGETFGGQVRLSAGQGLKLAPNVQITTQASGPGSVILTAIEDVTLEQGSQINIERTGFNPSLPGVIIIGSGITLGSNARVDATGLLGSPINIIALDGNVTLEPGSSLDSSGNFVSSLIDVQATSNLILEPESQIQSSGNIFGDSSTQGGEISINVKNLKASGGARILTNTFGQVDAGDINIMAADSIHLSGSAITPEGPISTAIQAEVLPGLEGGNGGAIELTAKRLTVEDGAQISATTFGAGDAGSIEIGVQEIQLKGETLDDQVIPSGIFAQATPGSTGKGGAILIEGDRLQVIDGAEIQTDTNSSQPAGDLTIKVRSLAVTGRSPNGFASVISAGSGSQSIDGAAGTLTITTQDFDISDGGLINLITTGNASGGVLNLTADRLTIENGGILAGPGENAAGNGGQLNFNVDHILLRQGGQITTRTLGEGDAGQIFFEVENLTLREGGVVDAITFGEGDAGSILIQDSQRIDVRGGSIQTAVEKNASGQGGPLTINTERLSVSQGGQIGTTTSGTGAAGDLTVQASKSIRLDGTSLEVFPSGLFANVQATGRGAGGRLQIQSPTLQITNGASIAANSLGQGQPGNINITADAIAVQGQSQSGAQRSQITANVRQSSATGGGGDIRINTGTLTYREGAQITSSSEGLGNAGQIIIRATGLVTGDNSDLTTSARQAAGGRIILSANRLRLQGDSDIRTDVASGNKGGGDINITARSIIAFDDSDILAFAQDGRGGNIRLNTPVFFGENRRDIEDNAVNLDQLDGNQRVDLNASGAIQSGVIDIPDVSFVESSLSALPDTLINTDNLLSNSCIARGRDGTGTFIVTGAGGLPTRPGQGGAPLFPTGKVRAGATDQTVHDADQGQVWQPGDPIDEPDGVYTLANGDRLLNRACHSAP